MFNKITKIRLIIGIILIVVIASISIQLTGQNQDIRAQSTHECCCDIGTCTTLSYGCCSIPTPSSTSTSSTPSSSEPSSSEPSSSEPSSSEPSSSSSSSLVYDSCTACNAECGVNDIPCHADCAKSAACTDCPCGTCGTCSCSGGGVQCCGSEGLTSVIPCAAGCSNNKCNPVEEPPHDCGRYCNALPQVTGVPGESGGCALTAVCTWDDSKKECKRVGGYEPYCNSGWGACPVGFIPNPSTSNTFGCHYPGNSDCNNTITCIQCVPARFSCSGFPDYLCTVGTAGYDSALECSNNCQKPACTCDLDANSFCGSYTVSGSDCTSVTCNGSLSCGSCQKCENNGCVADSSKIITGNCPSCRTSTEYVGACPTITCNSNCNGSTSTCVSGACCLKAETCPNNCGDNGEVANGSCGITDCGCKECGPVPSVKPACGPWTQTYNCPTAHTETGCTECSTCTPACGQSKTCTGTCSTADAGTPTKPISKSPLGTSTNPVIFNTGNFPITWNSYTDTSANILKLGIWDSSGSGKIKEDVNKSSTSAIASTVFSPSTFTPGTLYHWQLNAVNTTCSTITSNYWSDWTTPYYFKINRNPEFTNLSIGNSLGTIIPAETDNKNHICQVDTNKNSIFTDRKAKFSVTITDPDGGSEISEIELRFRIGTTNYLVASYNNGTSSLKNSTGGSASNIADFYTSVTTSTTTNTRTVNFPIVFKEPFNTALYTLEVYAQDIHATGEGGFLNWYDTTRKFKVWDCKVPVSGTFYDGSAGSNCPNTGYDKTIPDFSFGMDYWSDEGVKTMNVNSSASTYNNGTNQELIWGKNYILRLDGFPGNLPNQLKINDSECVGGIEFNSSITSAYSDSPSLQIDISSTLFQDPWFQTIGAGINSKSTITDNVPITCQFSPTTCQAAMTINGLVAGTQIRNDSGCGDSCQISSPNNWSITSNIISENYNYQYFYNRYFVNLGEGVVVSTWDEVKNKTGIVFVNGDLTINTDNNVPSGSFLMVIVNGDINVESSVKDIQGIFISNGQFTASGQSADQLTISGLIYSASTVQLNRSYTNQLENNSKPAVVVQYRPDFIFNMPGKLVKVLSGWREGQ